MGDEHGFTLRFEQREDYLFAFASGAADSLSVSTRFWEEIQRKARELGIERILVEEDFPNQLSTGEMFELAKHIAEIFGTGVRIAHVDRRLSDMDLNKFGETVAVNRFLNARVFNDVAEAEAWLRE